MIGDSGVGKTSLVRQLIKQEFRPLHDLTIGVEFECTTLSIADRNGVKKNVRLDVWDTAGLERFQAITHIYFKRCCIIFIVYDVSNKNSFLMAHTWLDTVRKKCKPHATVILIGNKSDSRNREVVYEEGLAFASMHGILFIETSARFGDNVRLAFRRPCETVIQHTVQIVENTVENGIERGNILEARELTLVVPSNSWSSQLSDRCCVLS